MGLSAALSRWRSLPPLNTAAAWKQQADVLGQVGGAHRKAKAGLSRLFSALWRRLTPAGAHTRVAPGCLNLHCTVGCCAGGGQP